MTRRVVLVLFLAAGMRFTGLGHESYWYDESVSVFNAGAPLADVPREVMARDVSPPLYFLVLALWMKVFGASEAAVRALSALGSLVGLWLFYRVALRLAGERVALLAAVLYAFAPFSIRFAQEARMYGLLLPLAWAAFLVLARELERPAPRWFWLSVLHLALLYTHAFGAFVPLLALLATLAVAGGRAALRLALWQVPVAVAFTPWAFVMLDQARVRMGGFWIGAPDLTSVHYLVYILAGGSPTAVADPVVEAASRLVVRLAYPFAACGVAGAWWRRASAPDSWRAARVAMVGLWLPVLLVFVVSRLVTPLFVDRYFLFLAPYFWLVLALAADLVPGRGAYLVVGAYLLLLSPVLHDHYARAHKEQWREAVAFARGSGHAADLIVDTGGIMNLIVYLKGADHASQLSTVVGSHPQTHLAPGELVARVAGARRLWVFYSPYAPDRGAYRRALAREFDEVAYRELVGLAVGCYRRR